MCGKIHKLAVTRQHSYTTNFSSVVKNYNFADFYSDIYLIKLFGIFDFV